MTDLTPEQAAIMALLDTVQRMERRIADLERDAAPAKAPTFTGLKVVNGRRGQR